MHNLKEGKNTKMVLTGDSLITRKLKPYKEPAYLEMLEIIREADISFTNLEGLLTNYDGYPAASSGGTYVVGKPQIANDLKWAGFNLFARANNHSMDWSFGGLLATSENLDERDMIHAGVGENLAIARSPAYLDTASGRAAIISASSTFPEGAEAGQQRPDVIGRPGLNPLRYDHWFEVPKRDIKELKKLAENLGLQELMRRFSRAFGSTDVNSNDKFAFPMHRSAIEFRASDKYKVGTAPNEEDLEANLHAIEGATRQADWVIFSLHSHESPVDDSKSPAAFMKQFAQKAIDAGADAVVGHGPHYLKGIEIYNGRPIFYSLGNFIFQNETIRWLPNEIYDRYNLSLESTPDELYDKRTQNDNVGFPASEKFWQTVLAEVNFDDRQLKNITLYPITLGWNRPRSRRGRPVLASKEEGKNIIKQLDELSSQYNVDVEWIEEKGVGKIWLD